MGNGGFCQIDFVSCLSKIFLLPISISNNVDRAYYKMSVVPCTLLNPQNELKVKKKSGTKLIM